ncbi:MAG TPA: hypothetical protein VFA68_16380 [Terriglobales bacterium]|nr:hypothetical protein [Terriglobales bacterium]
MKIKQIMRVIMFAMVAMAACAAQIDSTQDANASGQQPTTAPAPAYGQDTTPPANVDNPPISGLDQPSFEPSVLNRSFLIPGAHISQAIDTNVSGSTGNTAINGVTRVLGSLALQKLWSHFDSSLDYVGGGSFYSNQSVGATQVHTLDADERLLWRTGQLSLRDSFSYLPEGSFGFGSYGGAGALGGIGGINGLGGTGVGGLGIGSIGGSNFFGPGQFASLGQEPRITNTALADITESLSPRTSVTLAGSYGLVHFNSNNTGLINSRQVAAQAGYNYQFNRSNQVALVYGYQNFRYPNVLAGNFQTHLVNVLFGHRISGRMDLVFGGGPQVTEIHSPVTGNNNRISGSGRASLRYRFKVWSTSLTYSRYNSSGSGLFAGATSDLVRVTASRSIGRLWDLSTDVGYSHSERILPTVVNVPGSTYSYWYAGGSLHRQFGRDFDGYVSYQFNRLGFDQTVCTVGITNCSSNSQRHVLLIGFDWHPRPIRLD